MKSRQSEQNADKQHLGLLTSYQKDKTLAPIQLAIRFAVVICLATTAFAQHNGPVDDEGTRPAVTAFASSERVRFTAPASAVQIRLEVYNSAGRKVSDNEVRGGNVLDWRLEDGRAQRVADDTYLCVVTVKSLSGRITQRIGSATIENNAVSMQAESRR